MKAIGKFLSLRTACLGVTILYTGGGNIMSLIKKAFKDTFTNMSLRFKYVLRAGLAIFALQLIAVAAFYIVYLTSSSFVPEAKHFAQTLTTNALSFITLVIIACVTGDHILGYK